MFCCVYCCVNAWCAWAATSDAARLAVAAQVEGVAAADHFGGRRVRRDPARALGGVAFLRERHLLVVGHRDRAAVLAGAGPAVMSRLAVSDDLAHGRLRAVPIADLNLRRDLRAIWMGAQNPPAGAARDLLHHIATTR